MKSVYKRVLIKVSGEALAGKDRTGIDDGVLEEIGKRIKVLREEMGIEVAIVVGGGNFWRGAKNPEFDRTDADHMGMLATVMNALALADKLRDLGMKPFPMAAIQMDRICEFYVKSKADAHLKEGGVVILACGTGSPFFTTDTGAALRAAELKCDVILLAKNVDAVYDKDPAIYPDAKRYEKIAMSDVLAGGLKVMDLTATAFCLDNKIPVKVFGVSDPENIVRVCRGEKTGTDVICK